MSVFSTRLREVRKRENLTQRQVAKDLNCNYSTWSNWEQGMREPPYTVLVSIADYFEVSLDWLLGRTSEPGAALTTERPAVSEDVIAAGVALRDMVFAVRRLIDAAEDME